MRFGPILEYGRLCGACHAAIDLAEKRPELFVSTDAPPSRKFANIAQLAGLRGGGVVSNSSRSLRRSHAGRSRVNWAKAGLNTEGSSRPPTKTVTISGATSGDSEKQATAVWAEDPVRLSPASAGDGADPGLTAATEHPLRPSR